MNNIALPTHIFVAIPLEVRTVDGIPMPPIGPILTFTSTPEEAEGVFFGKGYILDSKKGLFQKGRENNSSKYYITESFETTPDFNSTEDDVPDRLSILVNTASPYTSGPNAGYPTENLRFGKLHVIRSVLPASKGGRSKTRRAMRSRKSTRKYKSRK